MRTNIDIDDELMREAMEATGLKTKKALVEAGLEILARRERLRQVIRDTAGICRTTRPTCDMWPRTGQPSVTTSDRRRQLGLDFPFLQRPASGGRSASLDRSCRDHPDGGADISRSVDGREV